MQVYIKPCYSVSERTFVLDIGNMRVVDDIKYHCVSVLPSLRRQLRLSLAGKPLEEHRALREYDIQEGCTIELLVRAGGGDCECAV